MNGWHQDELSWTDAGTGIPMGTNSPRGEGDGEKVSPVALDGEGDGEFSFPRGRGRGGTPRRGIPRWHLEFLLGDVSWINRVLSHNRKSRQFGLGPVRLDILKLKRQVWMFGLIFISATHFPIFKLYILLPNCIHYIGPVWLAETCLKLAEKHYSDWIVVREKILFRLKKTSQKRRIIK